MRLELRSLLFHVGAVGRHNVPTLKVNQKIIDGSIYRPPSNWAGGEVSSNTRIATLRLCLIPSVVVKKDDWRKNAENLASLYQVDLPAPLLLQTELHSWKHKCTHSQQHQLPDSPIATLNQCDDRLFPNISTLLKLVSTIPVTSCEAERTFSTLCRIKPFLRATMTENRLSGLALLHVHREISIELDGAVDRFARRHPRKLQLL